MTNTQARLSLDFWKFWTGQMVSNLGSSFTMFAMPLLIYQLTHSALNLALTMAAAMLPYLLFGLIIGAWVDRLNRKRLMIVVNVLMAANVASIPVMAGAGRLSVWWIYGVAFVGNTLAIFFNSAEFAAIPSLVGTDDLVTANGRIQASYFATMVLGPVLAGALAAFIAIPALMWFDAASFLGSAAALSLIGMSFNRDTAEPRRPSTIRQDVIEGLRYVIHHPVLRNISMMMALVNFVSTTTQAQLVLFGKQRFGATNTEIGILFGVEGVGMVLFSSQAGWFRKRWSFSMVALGCLAIAGALTAVFALLPWFWVALPIWGLVAGVSSLFNINTMSLRQAIVPNHMLGRVISIAGVLAWSAIPLGALVGGVAIQRTGSPAGVYFVIGILTMLIPLAFAFTPLGHADRYMPAQVAADAAKMGAEGTAAVG